MKADFLVRGHAKNLLEKIKNELNNLRTSNVLQSNDEYLALEAINPQDIQDMFELVLFGLDSTALIIEIITKIKNLIPPQEFIEIKIPTGAYLLINSNTTEVEIIKFADEAIIRIQKKQE